MRYLLSVLALATLAAQSSSFSYSIRSFNMYGGERTVANFGLMTKTRFEDETEPSVQDVITQIIGESILTITVGVRDAEVYDILKERLNRMYPVARWEFYHSVLDQNNPTDLGERTGFFYRADIIDVVDVGTWNGDDDTFQRSPVYANIKCSTCALKDFYLFGFHANVTTALAEIDAFPAFYKKMAKEFNNENIIFGGDMNAGYFVTPDEIDNSLASKEPGFKWLIDNDVDSFIYNNASFSIHRFLACNDAVANGFTDQGQAVDLILRYGLSYYQALTVSALNPVEVFIKFE